MTNGGLVRDGVVSGRRKFIKPISCSRVYPAEFNELHSLSKYLFKPRAKPSHAHTDRSVTSLVRILL